MQALAFYRVPLFLLPIYQAAAVEYGVPWQILAAINEIETNYGSDQSVSTAGAEGWMQFMPSTWLQYGVDALDAGYADPYNPVDAIFAAARYLRAAGAAQNLSGAILAYNHSQEYVDSVLLRAKLISSYPTPVIATLSGLVDGRPPVTGKRVLWGAPEPAPPASSSATANAVPVPGRPGSLQRLDGRPGREVARRRGAARDTLGHPADACGGGSRGRRQGDRGRRTARARGSDDRAQRRGGRGAERSRRRARRVAQAGPVRDPARRLRRHLHLRGPGKHRADVHAAQSRRALPRAPRRRRRVSATPSPRARRAPEAVHR